MNPSTVACPVPNTASVLALPALTISHSASARNTPISKIPRTVPVPALMVTPR